MPAFTRKPYPSSRFENTIGSRYRNLVKSHPFLLFGLPFVASVVLGSFLLTPATAVRYERFDRKTHALDREEALGLKKSDEQRLKQGKRDIREEYWRLAGQGDKLDDWEPKRIERLPGEPDGTL